MASTLFNRYNNMSPAPKGSYVPQSGGVNDLLQDVQQVQRDPGTILDIMLKRGKINTV